MFILPERAQAWALWHRPKEYTTRRSFLKKTNRGKLQEKKPAKRSPFSMQNPQDLHVLQDPHIPQHVQDLQALGMKQSAAGKHFITNATSVVLSVANAAHGTITVLEQITTQMQTNSVEMQMLALEQQTCAIRMEANSIAIRMAQQWNVNPSYSPDTFYSQQNNEDMVYWQQVDAMLQPEA